MAKSRESRGTEVTVDHRLAGRFFLDGEVAVERGGHEDGVRELQEETVRDWTRGEHRQRPAARLEDEEILREEEVRERVEPTDGHRRRRVSDGSSLALRRHRSRQVRTTEIQTTHFTSHPGESQSRRHFQLRVQSQSQSSLRTSQQQSHQTSQTLPHGSRSASSLLSLSLQSSSSSSSFQWEKSVICNSISILVSFWNRSERLNIPRGLSL